MRWFRCTNSIYYGGGSSSASAYNVVVGPYLYNTRLYGTENNLMYRVRLQGSILDQYYEIYPVSGTVKNYHYQRVIGAVDDRDLTTAWGEELENDIIGGTYRFYNNISSRMFGGWSIPCNFKITQTNGDVFIGDSLKANGYDDRFPSTGYCGFTAVNVENNLSLVIGSKSSSDTSSELTDSLKGFEIDFGRVPQNIPKFIKTWIEANAEYIYENSFTVQTYNGSSQLAKLVEAPAMISGNVSVIGDTKILNLTGANGRVYTLTWDSPTPENKIFAGLSFKPNHTVANIPVGISSNFNLEGDIFLYECYQVYKPPVETFSITLYKNSAEANRVDKTNYLTAVDTINGVLRNESSITDLEVTFESETVPQFNYVYIPIFSRYYFVNDISTIRYNLWRMNLSVDPLMTYKDAILSCFGFIDRNENLYNDYIIDKKMVIEQGVDVEVVEFGNDLTPLGNNAYRYVINGYSIGVGPQET